MECSPIPAQGVTTIVRQSTGDQLLISACGRTCSIDMQYSRSIVELQAALQRTLQMEGQAFHICDINGALLSSDMQVQDAISQGLTPLCATLPDKSLHHLENRREEIAQMQWKLVRDQMQQGSNQVTQLSRQISELQFQVQATQREATTAVDSMRQELHKALELERVTTKAEMQPVEEAVNGAVLLLNGERSKRELSVQGFEKHIHGVCDMLDGERAARRQDLNMHMSVMQELRGLLDTERYAREQLEETVADLKRSMSESSKNLASAIQDQTVKIQNISTDTSLSAADLTARFTELEDRSTAIESSLAEATSWSTVSFDKLGERCERVSQTVETMRLNGKTYEGSIASSLERVTDLETMIRQYDSEVREIYLKERQVRDDQVRRVQQVFSSDFLKQITEVEKRLTVRLERESAEREKNFSSMIDEVTKIVEDRKLFRDQTITKTIAGSAKITGGLSVTASPTGFDADAGLSASNFSYQPSDGATFAGDAPHERYAPARASGNLGGSIRSSTSGGPPRSATPTQARVISTASPVGSLSVPGGSLLLPKGAVTQTFDGQATSQPGSIRSPLGATSQPGSARGLALVTAASPASSLANLSTGSVAAILAGHRGSGSAPSAVASAGPSRLSGTQTSMASYPRVGQVPQVG